MKISLAFVFKRTCALSLLSDAGVPVYHLPQANFRSVISTSGAKELVRVRPTPFLLALLWAIMAMNAVSAWPARAQTASTATPKTATGTSTASHRAMPGVRTLAQTMKFIETTTPVNKPLLATTHYPNGQVSYMATVSAFAAKNCSTDSTLRVSWGSVVLDRQPHIDLGTLDPRKVEITTSDAYRKHVVSSQGGADVVSVTSPTDYFIGVPQEISLQNAQPAEDLQIFAVTDDKAIAEGLAKAYIFAIAACGHKPATPGRTGTRSASIPSVHEIERQSLMALAAQEKDAEAETAHDAETYATQAKVAEEKAAVQKAAREAAMAQAEQALQAAQAARAEQLRQWQARVDDLTEQVRAAEQDAVSKEQMAGMGDQLKQQSDGLTDVSAANASGMGTAGVILGSLGSIWGSHAAKKNRDAALEARAHANEIRAQLDAMGAQQPPPVPDANQPPILPADTSNPIQDELNKGLANINAAYAHDMALKQQQQQNSTSAYDACAARVAASTPVSRPGSTSRATNNDPCGQYAH